MNRVNRFLIAATSAASVAALGVGITQAASVPTSATTRPNTMSQLVTALAAKFNLQTADVQQVFDQQRTQMQAQMETERAAHLKTELDAAVKAGKLTQAQEDALIAKQAELKASMTAKETSTQTQTERETARTTAMTNLKTWLTANNIPEEYARFLMGGGKGGPGGGHGGFGHEQSPAKDLSAAVTAGKLTQAQADLITAKQAEIKTFMDSLQGKSQTDREASLKTQKTALQAWITANNIPTGYLHLPMGGGIMGGRGGEMRGGFAGRQRGGTTGTTGTGTTQR